MNKKVEQSEIIKNQAKNIERKAKWNNVDDILDENLSPSSYCLVHNYIIELHKEIDDLQKKAELGEQYKHLYSEVKKQKDDVVELIYKKMRDVDIYGTQIFDLNEILRMLGEIDVED